MRQFKRKLSDAENARLCSWVIDCSSSANRTRTAPNNWLEHWATFSPSVRKGFLSLFCAWSNVRVGCLCLAKILQKQLSGLPLRGETQTIVRQHYSLERISVSRPNSAAHWSGARKSQASTRTALLKQSKFCSSLGFKADRQIVNNIATLAACWNRSFF